MTINNIFDELFGVVKFIITVFCFLGGGLWISAFLRIIFGWDVATAEKLSMGIAPTLIGLYIITSMNKSKSK